MPAILQQEWLNQNAGRAYPFRENMSRRPSSPSGALLDVQLPNYVIVDLVVSMPLPNTMQAGQLLQLSQFAYVGNLVTMSIAALGHVGGFTVAVDTRTHVANTPYPMVGTGDIPEARGWVVVGDLSNLARDMPQGLYEFAGTNVGMATTLFEPTVVRPTVRGVRSITVVNGENESVPLYGNVKLLAGSNMRLRYDATRHGIFFDADPSSGYVEPCECDNELPETTVKTINGIPVEDVTIQGDDCVSVTTSGNVIRISDTCSKPCCGCEELNYLLDSVKIIETSLSTLETFATQLSERVNNFITSYILTAS